MEPTSISGIDYVILALMLAVLVVLGMGIFQLLKGGDAARSNRLMFWRVGLQGLVLVLAALFLVAK